MSCQSSARGFTWNIKPYYEKIFVNVVLSSCYWRLEGYWFKPSFSAMLLIGVGRGGGDRGQPLPPIIWEGGTYPLPPPHPIIHPHFPSISMWNRKISQMYQAEGLNNNVTLIWFEGTCKTIPFNSILEFSILSDFKMRNEIIWHWFIKNLVGTWRRNDVDATSLRRIDVSTTSYACWEFAPPPCILNLAPSIF